jgi:hypothetical protein
MLVCAATGVGVAATSQPRTALEGESATSPAINVTPIDPIALPYVSAGSSLPPATTATIYHDLEALPSAARRLRDELIAAAKTGEVEAFVPILARQTAQPQLTFEEVSDPIEFLRRTSNDGDAREVMAILEELLEAPYAAFNEGAEDEFYVWPYFVATDLEQLSPSELVDCYKIVSHQDLQEMRDFGGWFFYRVAISARGEWLAFVAGD